MATRPQVTLEPGRDVWDQQPRESSRQYERFRSYRDLGRMRSLTTITKVLTGIGDNLTYGTIRTQSYLYRWNERAQAWDRHQDEQDHERVIQERRELISRHKKIAGALITKALTALREIDAATIDPADVIRFLKLATDLEIRAIGEPNQTISVTGPAGGPIQTEDLTGLTDQERRVRLRAVVAELASRSGLTTTATGDIED